MPELWKWVLPALLIALILCLSARNIIGTYFKRKEAFVDKMVNKLKGANNGKRP